MTAISKKRRPWQFALRSLLAVLLLGCIGMSVLIACIKRTEYFRAMCDVRDFSRTISSANRIVLRDGFSHPMSYGPVLLTVADRQDVADFRKHLDLLPDDNFNTWYHHDHICYGHLTIEWYRGRARIAHARLMGGVLQECKGFRGEGDPHLTTDAANWLRNWLADHGLPTEHLNRTVPEPAHVARHLPGIGSGYTGD